jgi:phosphoenolpyruvate-protein phosphotransferase (PTS system enzyme I)
MRLSLWLSGTFPMTVETIRLRGRSAAPGLAVGRVSYLANGVAKASSLGSPEAERAALEHAVATAAAELRALADAQPREAAEILEFQLTLLEDEDLSAPAYAEIGAGASAGQAWARALDTQIADYKAADDEYFRARASDFIDIRDRVSRAFSRESTAAPAPPNGAILVADDLAPSRFLEIDWTRGLGIALKAGSATSHVATLARARAVPMVVSLGEIPAADGEWVLLDGERGEVEIGPSEAKLADWRARVAGLAKRRADESLLAKAPAVTRSGRRILTLVNIQGLDDLSPEAAYADGIGLVRTEFLFEPGHAPPNEAAQYEAYRAILDWAGAKPVIIRVLDAGGDKPIAGVTFDGEANPFLGVRGLRLLLRRQELFRTQLRALARAAAGGDLKVMLPMVTTPGELAEARTHLDAVMAELESKRLPARRPPLGIMVEVPAAALTIDRFDADFYSIGSNDLVQYVTACDRGAGELAALADPLNPAVLELIRRTVEHGKKSGASVSLCGDMAADPRCAPALIACGLEAFSVAPSALGRLKAAIARCG